VCCSEKVGDHAAADDDDVAKLMGEYTRAHDRSLFGRTHSRRLAVAATREANLITCATTSTEPLVRGEWLQPGTHLDLVGGFKRNMREVDDQAVRRARVGADTYAGALAEAGDHAQPIDRGVIDRAHVIAELAEVLRGEKQVRTSANDITLFKSVGTALEDLTAVRCALSA
jgi:alanine dehydrogenase